jgi:hypothetical protein
MKVLLVWNEVPEKTSFFGIPDPTADELAVLALANGIYINTTGCVDDVEVALDKLNAAVAEPQNAKYCEPVEWRSRWHAFEIEEKDIPSAGGFDQIFSSGFIL